MFLALLLACLASVPRVPGPLAAVRGRSEVPAASAAPAPAAATPGAKRRAHRELGDRLANAAERNLTGPMKAGYRADCSGFVEAALQTVDVPWRGSTRDLWAVADAAGAVHRRKEPELGDLAFFDDTYDRDRNGRNDDELTHIAIVIDVWPDGTIQLAHDGTSVGRDVLWMNLHHPEVAIGPAGERWNDVLRSSRKRDPKGTKSLSGGLWRGFATVPANAVEDPG